MKKTSKPKEKIVSYTVEELGKMKSKTDWARIDAMQDKNIDYSDIPEADEAFWANAKIIPPIKRPVSIRVDNDVLVWFKNQKGRYQTLINAVLRQYMNTHKRHHQK